MKGLTILDLYSLDSTCLDSYKKVEQVLDGETYKGIKLNVIWPDIIFNESAHGYLITAIMARAYSLDCAFQSPDLLKGMLENYISVNLERYRRLFRTTIQEYEIIHNFDRTEEIEETSEYTGENKSENTTTGNNTATQDSKNATFENPAHMKTAQRVESTDNTNANTTGSTTATTKNTNTRKARLYGNIGVTTTQQMLEEERKLLEFDIVGKIVDDFIHNFCIMVY